MDVILIPADARLGHAVSALRDAAGVYGWGLEAEEPDGGVARVRVVPGTCTRRPEARRVLERARCGDQAVVEGVEIVREGDAAPRG